jgi:hypothetical protein
MPEPLTFFRISTLVLNSRPLLGGTYWAPKFDRNKGHDADKSED